MRTKSQQSLASPSPGSPESTQNHKPAVGARRLRLLLALLGVLGVVAWFVIPAFRGSPVERAAAAAQAGDVPRAVSLLEAHLQSHPDADDARLQLAQFVGEANPEVALEHLQRISLESPEAVAALRAMAVICLKTHRDAEARHVLTMLEQQLPDDFGVQLSLAELLFHQEDYVDALPYATRAARLQPDRTQTWLLIAEIHDELNQRPDMIAPLETALQQAPEEYQVHAMLAYAYSAANRLEDARREAEWCLQRRTDDAYPHRILASIARDEGRFDDAHAALERALALAPDDVDCRVLEADLLMYERQYDRAYERLRPLLDQHADDFAFLGALARAAAATGHTDEARHLHTLITKIYDRKRK